MLIVDAGPLYAAGNARDSDHAACTKLPAEATGAPLVGQLVVSEVSYMLGNRLGAEAEITVAQSITDGEPSIEPVVDSDWSRITEPAKQYADLPLGIVDASVVALAERLGLTEIATLDRRHFRVVGPRHVGSFTLLP